MNNMYYICISKRCSVYQHTQRLPLFGLRWTETLHMGLTSHANSEFLNARKKESTLAYVASIF